MRNGCILAVILMIVCSLESNASGAMLAYEIAGMRKEVIDGLILALNDITDTALSGSTLPATLDLSSFTALRTVNFWFSPNNGGACGDITSLNVVPLPGAAYLFLADWFS